MLTDKQRRFCDKYLINLNATKAYKSVYKVKRDRVAAAAATRLLVNVNVSEYIQSRKKKLNDRIEITQEMVLEGFRRLAFYDSRKFYDTNGNLLDVPGLDEETAYALTGFEVMEEKGGDGNGKQVSLGYTKKIKMSDRKGALDSLGKYLGIFEKDNSQIAPKMMQPLSDVQVDKIITALRKK